METQQETRGQHTLTEIVSQPYGWGKAYEQLVGRRDEIMNAWAGVQPQQIIVTGCGSTHYLSQTAAALLQGLTGIPARGLPASEIVLFPDQVLYRPEETLLLAISRSGTTTETAAAMDKFRSLGGKAVWGITCYADTPVGQESDFMLLTDMAQEQSIAQTLSFSTMLFTAQGVAAVAGEHDLTPLGEVPKACEQLIQSTYGLATHWGTEPGVERFFFLGSGPLYGMACEAMLKMKEMSITHAEAYHFLEFRHGPKALVDEHAMVVGMIGAQTFRHEAAVITEMAEMGGKTVTLVPGNANAGHVTVHLPDHLPAWTMPVLYLPVVQSMAHARSMEKGLDPDNPRNLSAVVFLDRGDLG
ncbi:MAG: SIS domain-containing protein [Caldilineaceae bacterium]|nr:SIS domain-containing protein [Caldilineaceae bacterium]